MTTCRNPRSASEHNEVEKANCLKGEHLQLGRWLRFTFSNLSLMGLGLSAVTASAISCPMRNASSLLLPRNRINMLKHIIHVIMPSVAATPFTGSTDSVKNRDFSSRMEALAQLRAVLQLLACRCRRTRREPTTWLYSPPTRLLFLGFLAPSARCYHQSKQYAAAKVIWID